MMHLVTATFIKILTFVKKKLEGYHLNIPRPRPLPNEHNGTHMLFVIVGDETIVLSQQVLRLYFTRNLDIARSTYNYRLTRARRMVECAFGILCNKWRIVHRAIEVCQVFCDVIVKTP
jgi:hypothetical protein